ncbi:hypothetical protein FHS56_000201 [Thermonema lapsum]|uniref:Amidohydrolase 3 domain-containing protein n=1 Tax=Thermonema lapsum TaxID=28195 RepID=A0A846MMP5_9BACT|nr:amidohydrolase [Thermonema lapsum]NIK72715.1 hypothetical protein [Thermonema lapsum]
MIHRLLLLPLLLLVAMVMMSCEKKHQDTRREKVDMLVVNATIYTVDSAFAVAEAMAVKNGLIVATGSRKDLEQRYDAQNVYDAGGHFIFPGFYDAHCHFVGYAQTLAQADLVGTTSPDEVIARLKAFREQNSGLSWLLGRGWDQNDWESKAFPDRRLLDEAFPDIPVFLTRIDGHAAWVNTKALQEAGLLQAKKVEGGSVRLRPDGSPSGILIDNAMDLVKRQIPPMSRESLTKLLMKAEQNCFSVGLTTLSDAGLPLEHILLLDSLHKAGSLRMRLYVMASATPENLAFFQKNGRIKTDRLHVRSFKIYADGALGSRGAFLLEPYHDAPTERGFLLKSEAALDSLYSQIAAMDFQANTHCIGDAANRTVLRLYAKYLKGGERWRIEHAQVVQPQDLSYFRTHGIIPSVQPTHATSDMYWAENRLGKERIAYAYAYKNLLEAAGLLALGTDFPVEQISPFLTFYAALSRKDLNGFPPEGFLPEQALSRRDILKGMTIWAAYANFEEKERGSLEAGKQADFIVVDRDLMKVEVAAIPEAKVLATFIAGEQVYDAKGKK